MSETSAHSTFSILRQTFFLSFFFSQGNAILQRFLYRYVALRHPTWRISEADHASLLYHLDPVIQRLVERGLHEPLAFSPSPELEAQSLLFARELAESRRAGDTNCSEQEQWETALLVSILQMMVLRDHHFLVEMQGRPRLPAGVSPVLLHYNPWLSHLCHFVLHSRRSGNPVFDMMFKELLPQWMAHKDQDSLLRTYAPSVIDCYHQHHPPLFEIPSDSEKSERK